MDSVADIIALCDYLDTMRGLDENGNNADKAQVSGTIRVENITGSQLAAIKERYPDIHVVYENIVSYLYFYDDMGENLLHTAEVVNGGDGAYTGATPTKASTAQYNYTFAGWSKSVGGAVDADALKNVIADRNVYAVFTSEIRSYTIRFYNGNTLLQTSTVPYGEMPVYTGAEPTPEVDYKFVGWTPNIEIVTGDVDYVARFVSTKSVARSIIDKSITEYSNDEIESIGKYVFKDCSALVSINTPNVKSVDDYAFDNCSNLTSIDMPKVTSLGDHIFSSCRALTSLNMPNVTSIGTQSFSYCSKLASIRLPKNPPSLPNTYAFNGINAECIFYIPNGSLSLYENATNWATVVDKYSFVEEDR
jgi:hypothetical protein